MKRKMATAAAKENCATGAFPRACPMSHQVTRPGILLGSRRPVFLYHYTALCACRRLSGRDCPGEKSPSVGVTWSGGRACRRRT